MQRAPLVSSSKHESVQAPKELERMNSIGEETFTAVEETSSIQMRIPSAIPIVNTPISQQPALHFVTCRCVHIVYFALQHALG